jgi:hypothetical protein
MQGGGSDPMLEGCQEPGVSYAWVVNEGGWAKVFEKPLFKPLQEESTTIVVHILRNQVPISRILLKGQCMVKNVHTNVW